MLFGTKTMRLHGTHLNVQYFQGLKKPPSKWLVVDHNTKQSTDFFSLFSRV